MNTEFYAYGEFLWDCLPSGRHAGGAPFNVAAHLAQLGVTAGLISAVGQDALGDELLALAQEKRVDVEFVGRARAGLPTGTVTGAVDADGNATYDIVQPVAWDEIAASAEGRMAVSAGSALVFGSLAGRSPFNSEQLDRLLTVQGPLKFFDVNLRPPFDDPRRIVDLAARADVIKLNDDEIGQLASYLDSGTTTLYRPTTPAAAETACGRLAEATGAARICVTMGAEGAALWQRGTPFIHVPAPPTLVKDTVGAGDAFMAGLVIGLTRGADPRTTLECACRLGAYVASQAGATPPLPPEMVTEFAGKLFVRTPALHPRNSPFHLDLI